MTQEDALETVEARLIKLANAAKAAGDVAEDAKEARDAAIEEADLDGMSTKRIAKLVGLSRSGTALIIEKRTAARQAALRRGAGI